MNDIDDHDRAILMRMGLLRVSTKATYEPLPGGVSSDIRKITISGRAVVLKRALSKLNVAAVWHAPVSRGQAEARWLTFASSVVPDAVPRILATDEETYAIALEYLPPEEYPNWKSLLLRGDIDDLAAARVGAVIGQIHSVSTATPNLAYRFANQSSFESLRIEPYLRRSAEAAPEAARPLAEVIALLEAPGRALVHGDVSPKNILMGPESPVLLDAECATWSDPAFDVAFCLAHLALKSEHDPANAERFSAAAAELRHHYLKHVTWEDPAETDDRIQLFLPALMLARVAGASPVEYLDESARKRVRRRAVQALRTQLSYNAKGRDRTR